MLQKQKMPSVLCGEYNISDFRRKAYFLCGERTGRVIIKNSYLRAIVKGKGRNNQRNEEAILV